MNDDHAPLRVRSTDPELFSPVRVDEQLLALVQSVVMSFNVVARDLSAGFSQMSRISSASITLQWPAPGGSS